MFRLTLLIFLITLPLLNVKGQHIIDSLMLAADASKGEKKAEILYKISGEFLAKNSDSALRYLEEAEFIVRDEQSSAILPMILLRTGKIFHDRNESEKSLMYLRHAFDLFKGQNNLEQTGFTGLRIGNIYYQLGDYLRAFEYYLESIEAYKKIGDISRIAHLTNNLGTIAHETGDFSSAESYYRESLQLYEQSGDSGKTVKVLNNIGMLLYDMQRYDSALFYLRRVLEQANDQSAYGNYLISSASNNIALIHFDLDQIEEGLEYLYQSLAKSLQINNPYNITSAFVNLGSFHTELGNFDSADYYLEKGLRLSDSLGYLTLKHDALHEKSLMYAERQDWVNAYFWNLKADTVDDELFSTSMSRKIENLKIGYEQDLKSSEIERLRNEKTNQIKLAYAYLVSIVVTIILIIIIAVNLRAKRSANRQLSDKNIQLTETIQRLKDSEEQLMQLNKSKDRIFSIIAHDLRNPVAAVGGFTELLYDNFDQLNIETQKEYLLQIMQGTQRMHNLLENMLIWARTQMKAVKFEPTTINVSHLVEDGVKQVAANLNHKKIKCHTKIDPGLEVFADYPMILTVIRNILMNAIKFSFPGGTIEISANIEAKQVLINIRDQGIGIQQEIQEKIFNTDNYISTPGTSGESGSGLGLKISREFMEKNSGEIGVRSEPGKGSVFYIKLPLPS
ncbi:MAG: tetratricopeptide repeat protein [Bacteroidales bacterium]|nr:tetratricopeptide repeat protein [Bacteroidales bacterium]